jgi:hypothetical protein
VYVTTENPAVVFALTCDVIVPCVLLTAAPPAFHCQATYEFAPPVPELTSVVSLPKLKPSAVKAVNVFAFSASRAVVFDDKYLVAPLAESNRAWNVPAVRFLIHTKSGWNDTLFTAFDSDRAAALPV